MPSIIGIEEDLQVTSHNDVYPFIDPKVHYDSQTYAGKVVLITGASRGIGLETAIFYARAGASLTLIARKQNTLDESKDAILREQPSAQVLTFPADVRDVKKAEEAVAATVARFGRLDILVTNAAILRPMVAPFATQDPTGWWDVLEVNIRGVYNYIHFGVPELLKTNGQIVVVTSAAAQFRVKYASDYCTSKHALHRLAEFVAIENPSIRIFCVHPGVVKTELNIQAQGSVPAHDTAALPAATILYLTSGKADYLSGRYVAAPWDLGEVERDWKEKIITQNVLINKLAVPQ
ncbi:NAD-P-binding protein [Multifurca ochricompacta]|uniref:NAD-P-binding protein n=1 Tax=Multifurca ochricompacta TaxID=376703 RepID=A0AAD4M5L1_9AGAM|nr:NAD-P-binding protein [Multifurca ochricompacta]